MRDRFFSIAFILVLLICLAGCSSCRRQNNNTFTIALATDFSGVDPNIRPNIDASGERLRQLMFNSLVKKDEKFDYVADLAQSINRSDDGLSYTFVLRDNVKFHNGQIMTSADVKYTLETLLNNDKALKNASFFYEEQNQINENKQTPQNGQKNETPTNVQNQSSGSSKKPKKPYVASLETPDQKTFVIKLHKPWLSLLSNLVSIAIIPQGTADIQKDTPIGSGPFKYVRKEGSILVELERFQDYWEGAPQIERVVVKVVKDANSLQAELKSGNTTVAPLPNNLTADALKTLGQDPKLSLHQFTGSTIVYLGFNTKVAPLNNVKVRQAFGFAIDREMIVKELLKGQAKVANSIMPEESWAYTAGNKYNYDTAKAKQLLDEAGFKDPDGDGPQMRFKDEIVFTIAANNTATSQYAQVIQQSLKQIGVPMRIETLEFQTFLKQFRQGQYQMVASNWVGGNEDPIFYKDLFATSESPDIKEGGRNRYRYSNPEFDKIINEAVDTADKQKALKLYTQAQEIISRDVPLLPLWYSANMVIAQKSVSNINLNQSGDWTFVKSLTVEKK